MKERSGLTSASGALLLVLASALWGCSFVLIKQLSPGMSASAICMCRFVLAAAVLLAFLRADRKMWRLGIELGAWLFAGYATQAVALRYTSVNRSAFITAMYVVITPMIAAGRGHRVRLIVWIAALMALAGCALLCGEGGGPNVGDAFSFLTAITWAVYIYRMEEVAAQFKPLPLAVAQLVPVALFSSAWYGLSMHYSMGIAWLPLIVLALGCTGATTILQAAAQQVVPAPQAAVLFTLDPVFAAIFGFFILREVPSLRALAGAIVIIAAAVLCQAPGLLDR